MMYKEFYGLPGCGKTHSLDGKFSTHHFNNNLSVLFSLKVFFKYFFTLTYCFKYGITFFKSYFTRYYLYELMGKDYVSDHGFVQTLAQFNIYDEYLIKCFPKGEYVFLDVPISVCKERMLMRENWISPYLNNKTVNFFKRISKDLDLAEKTKEYYNKQKDYNVGRWSNKKELLKHKNAILFHMLGSKTVNCLEIGCGAGEFSDIIGDGNDFLDISQTMIDQNPIQGDKFVCNFLDFPIRKKYDFIMGIRTIKYMPDKERVFKKIYDLLDKDGVCILINQSIDSIRQRFFRFLGIKDKDLIQAYNVSIKDIRMICEDLGFKVSFFPVASRGVDLDFTKPLGFFKSLITGSYLIKLEKL